MTKLIALNNTIESFSNGITFSGNGGKISGNVIRDVYNNGINGGDNPYPSPSNYEISDNYIDARLASDGITLHDGVDGPGYGDNNKIQRNTILAGRENALDILGQYQGTLIEDNILTGGEQSVIGTSGLSGGNEGTTNTIIRGNKILSGVQTAIWSRGNNTTITNNTITGVKSTSGANAFIAEGTNTIITDNVVDVPVENNRVIFLIHGAAAVAPHPHPYVGPVPSGAFLRNVITNFSSQSLIAINSDPGFPATSETEYLSRWVIDNNTYKVINTSAGNFPGNRTFTSWKATNFGGTQPYKDAASTYSAAVGGAAVISALTWLSVPIVFWYLFGGLFVAMLGYGGYRLYHRIIGKVEP